MRTYGNISLRINGAVYQGRGTFTLEEGAFSFEAGGNADGSVYRTQTPTPPKLEMALERGPFVWNDAMIAAQIDATVTERATGRQHIITDARWIGRPAQNLTTGEVTGLSITWDPGNKQTIG
jgi:hypothetical protein